MANIEFEKSESKQPGERYKDVEIRISEDGVDAGYLQYHYENNMWNLDDVRVNPNRQGHGLGKQLLEQFVKEVGHKKRVYGVVMHAPTIAAMTLHHNPDIPQFSHGKYEVPQDELRQDLFPNPFPIVPFLRSGGINVEKMTVERIAAEPYYNIEMFGRTQ